MQSASDVRVLLELGAHQLLGMRVPSHAALSETVNLAKSVLRPNLSGFVNGVLRRVSERTREEWLDLLLAEAKTDVAKLSIRYSHPEWVIRAIADSLKVDGRADELEALRASPHFAELEISTERARLAAATPAAPDPVRLDYPDFLDAPLRAALATVAGWRPC